MGVRQWLCRNVANEIKQARADPNYALPPIFSVELANGERIQAHNLRIVVDGRVIGRWHFKPREKCRPELWLEIDPEFVQVAAESPERFIPEHEAVKFAI